MARLRAIGGALAVTLGVAACERAPVEETLPPTTVAVLQEGSRPGSARVTLGAYVQISTNAACVHAPDDRSAEHCWIPGVTSDHPLARHLRHETDDDSPVTVASLSSEPISVVVRVDSVPADGPPALVDVPPQRGTLEVLEEVPDVDRAAIAQLHLRQARLQSLFVFRPDVPIDYEALARRRMLQGAAWAAAALGVLLIVLFQRRRRRVPTLEARGYRRESAAPSRPPSVKPSVGPPAPRIEGGSGLDLAFDMAPTQRRSAAPSVAALVPGAEVLVQRTPGGDPVPAMVLKVRPQQVLCDFGAGRQAWVDRVHVTHA